MIMQVQCAAVLGRLPSVCSLLVNTSQTEMDRFKAAHSGTAIDEDTPCVSVAQLWSGAQLSADKAPPAVVKFVKAAARSGDTLLPYYGLYRLARCLFKPNEEITASYEWCNVSIQDPVQRFPSAVLPCYGASVPSARWAPQAFSGTYAYS